MQLPNAQQAIVDITKLRDYILSAIHQRGRHKARVFRSALGMTAADADELQTALSAAVLTCEAVSGVSDEFGDRYTIDFEITRSGKSARVRSSWIVLLHDGLARLTTCYILKKSKG